jgi:hypothetical protein
MYPSLWRGQCALKRDGNGNPYMDCTLEELKEALLAGGHKQIKCEVPEHERTEQIHGEYFCVECGQKIKL